MLSRITLGGAPNFGSDQRGVFLRTGAAGLDDGAVLPCRCLTAAWRTPVARGGKPVCWVSTCPLTGCAPVLRAVGAGAGVELARRGLT